MKYRGTKALAMLLTLAMVVGLVPGMGLTAYAAPTETLLTTITATGQEQANYSTANVATVSFSYTAYGSSAYTAIWGWWGYGFIATVTPADGYTITKCVFYDDADRTATDSEAPFVVETTEQDKTPKVNGAVINYSSKGIKKIEVYGYATPATTYEVTYKVVNGTWSDGTTADKTETVASGAKPTSVPTGMIPSAGYTGGAWDTNPATATITGATTFTYTFGAIPTYTVTYRVVNGTWSDGTTADKTETVASGAKPTSVPTGMIPSAGYTGGAWDTNPATATITGATTFTYTFGAIPTYTVTYRVVNGTWSDGTTADKTETVASGAKPTSVPTGMIPSAGYTGGAWDTNPATATITGATTFTYTFGAIPTYTVTYRVVNGTWSDGSTADKTETVQSGAKPANVPTGMIPSAGYTGGAWSTNPADATITEATIFTYIFTATPTFNVTVSETPNGTVTASKTTATAGENITLTITPASGYQIQATTVTDVNNNNIPVSNNSFTMPAADVTVTVTFIQIPVSTYTVTVANTPNGTVTASKTTAAAGENITLTISPASGYQVQAITVTDVNNNNISVTNNSFTMPAANVFVTVTFIESPVQPTTYTVSFFANGGGGVMNPVTVPANTVYTLPACGFTPPAGKQFKAWQLGSTEFAPGDTIKVDSNAEFVALWKDDEGSGESGHGGITGDIVFIGGFNDGADEWYDGGYAPQRAWKVKLAPMVNGSAALGIMTGESTTTEMNVYPTTTIYVFPNANPGFVLDKIIWSYIDGTASYDITEAKNFVMPAMDVVVYVTFKPLGS